MRGFLLTVCAAWITAVLLVSPIVAGLECQRCCNSAQSAASRAPAQSPCCAAHQEPERQERCPSCPKCEAKRPVPATAQKHFEWKSPLDLVVVLPRSLEDDRPVLRGDDGWGRQIVDHSTPPPRILFCTWRE